jgi:hypothetical protein
MLSKNTKAAPQLLIYGEYSHHESFAVLPETQAEGLAREVQAVQACTTVGEARRLARTLEFAWPPPGIDIDDEEGESLPDDAPYDWSEGWEGGWPQMPGEYSLHTLPGGLQQELMSKTGAEIIQTVHDGEYLAVPLDREADLVHTLRAAGYQVRRDDKLIAIIGLMDETTNW